MFGMGMTMTLDDFKGVMQSPKAVAIGVAAQFVVMPSCGLSAVFIVSLAD